MSTPDTAAFRTGLARRLNPPDDDIEYPECVTCDQPTETTCSWCDMAACSECVAEVRERNGGEWWCAGCENEARHANGQFGVGV